MNKNTFKPRGPCVDMGLHVYTSPPEDPPKASIDIADPMSAACQFVWSVCPGLNTKAHLHKYNIGPHWCL